MKINWGTGIVIAIIGFISFIMYFVITMSTDNTYSHDLVTEKYYQQELNYQQEINAEKNAKNLQEKINFEKTKKGLKINFPTFFTSKNIEGKVFLYRPSNKQLDFEMPISISNTYLLVPEQRLVDGRWNIKVLFKDKNKNYLFKKELVY
ncbi:FixH family protein [Polaribacter porphyrae]|uniref:Cytochrome C oxidase Cbb3 n=1 Tax=Polaribacter porphyrae TaxID=1137780 RepID=A0A2S7WKX7_9FLAO|nr:FixH family protein [Polaribacter porphyrae]PQJ78233.1 cytochrome C oxidase Cbb3 [Polaribacter porphyrae]